MTTLGAKDYFLPWAGLFGGVLAWYGAHEISFYLSRVNCDARWLVAVIHLVASSIAIGSGDCTGAAVAASGATGAGSARLNTEPVTAFGRYVVQPFRPRS